MSKKIGILLVFCLLLGFGCKKTVQAPTEQQAATQQAEEQKKLQAEKKEIYTSMQAIAATDADFDGLNAEEEKAAGTDPAITDTDNDGVTDYDEVKVHKTSPVKADTDGDGKSDGYEIRRSQNPLAK